MDASKLMELVKAKKASLKQKAKTIKANPGANRYVLLPGWADENIFWHDFGQHYIKDAAGAIQAVYPCADKTYGDACPICSGLQSAMRMTTDDDTTKILKEAVSKQSYLLNVLALDSDDAATPQILEVGKAVFGQIFDILDEWGVAIFDPEQPQIIVINREGKGLNTKYTVQVSPKKHALPKGVMSKINNLDEYVKQESEDQKRRALNAINSVAGLLPAPSGKDTPKAADKPPFDSDDEELRSVEKASVRKDEILLGDDLDDLLSEIAA